MHFSIGLIAAVLVICLVRFGLHYRRHFQIMAMERMGWIRQRESIGPPISLSFRYRDAKQGGWRLVTANIGEVVRYGEHLFLKGLEEGSQSPRVFRWDGLVDLRERPHGMPIVLEDILNRKTNFQIHYRPEVEPPKLPGIYRQAQA